MKKLLVLCTLVCSGSYAMDEKWVAKEQAWIDIGRQHLVNEAEKLKNERETLNREKDKFEAYVAFERARYEAQQRANDIAELSAALEVMKLVGHHKHDDNNFGYRCNKCGASMEYTQRVYPHQYDEDSKKRNISYSICPRCGFKDSEQNRLESVRNSAAVVILNHKFKSTQIAEKNNVKQEDIS